MYILSYQFYFTLTSDIVNRTKEENVSNASHILVYLLKHRVLFLFELIQQDPNIEFRCSHIEKRQGRTKSILNVRRESLSPYDLQNLSCFVWQMLHSWQENINWIFNYIMLVKVKQRDKQQMLFIISPTNSS